MTYAFNHAVPVAGRLLADMARRLRPGGLRAGLPAASGDGRFVIVTGAGRSGTSAVARVLHESGVRMGAGFGSASDLNPEGFYEDMAVVLLHERMLTELGMGDIWRPERWPWRSAVLAAGDRYREDMKALVASATDGWKDPRFAITLEAWLPLLPVRPKVVVCLRSPRAYAESVVRGFGFVNRDTAQRQWAKHYRRLLDVVRDYRLEATSVEYDALIEDPQGTVASLAAFVGEPLKAELVNASLRRFVQPVPRKYARLYREVWELGREHRGGALPGGPVALTGPSASQKQLDRRRDIDDRLSIAEYGRQVSDLEARMEPAKALWTERVGLPDAKVVEYRRLGITLPDAMEQTCAACERYIAAVKDAQAALASLTPPTGFERHLEMLEGAVNAERMVAEFTLGAAKGGAPDGRMLKAALRWWRREGRPARYKEARERRRREFARAVARSGDGRKTAEAALE